MAAMASSELSWETNITAFTDFETYACPEPVSRIICHNCSCLDGIENYSATVQHFDSLIRDTWGEPDIPFGVSILLTTVYALIFVTGLLGNICTCLVIARNRYMQTATNYYLFSLALSDIMLLVLGTPDDIVRSWFTYPYIFGDSFCRVRGMAAEACTYASILIITAFTIERWLAICHPMCTAHRLFNPTGRQNEGRLSQVKMVIVALWILGFLCAVPQAITFRVIYETLPDGTIIENMSACNVGEEFQSFSKFSFVFSAFFMFVLPMVLITVLYIHIAVSLRNATLKVNGDSAVSVGGQAGRNGAQRKDYHHNHKNVLTMLVAVVIAFFVCWAPFHAQRLLALVYEGDTDSAFRTPYAVLHFLSGIMYYVSATINPILYSILSAKFRKAFQDTWSDLCGPGGHPNHRTPMMQRPAANGIAMNSLGPYRNRCRSPRMDETTCDGISVARTTYAPSSPVKTFAEIVLETHREDEEEPLNAV